MDALKPIKTKVVASWTQVAPEWKKGKLLFPLSFAITNEGDIDLEIIAKWDDVRIQETVPAGDRIHLHRPGDGGDHVERFILLVRRECGHYEEMISTWAYAEVLVETPLSKELEPIAMFGVE